MPLRGPSWSLPDRGRDVYEFQGLDHASSGRKRIAAALPRPAFEGGWRAEKRKILMARALRHAGALRRANRGGFGTGPCFRPVRRAANAPTDPSASSWQGLLVAPEGAPLPPECLVARGPRRRPLPPSQRLARAPLRRTRCVQSMRSSGGGDCGGTTLPRGKGEGHLVRRASALTLTAIPMGSGSPQGESVENVAPLRESKRGTAQARAKR